MIYKYEMKWNILLHSVQELHSSVFLMIMQQSEHIDAPENILRPSNSFLTFLMPIEWSIVTFGIDARVSLYFFSLLMLTGYKSSSDYVLASIKTSEACYSSSLEISSPPMLNLIGIFRALLRVLAYCTRLLWTAFALAFPVPAPPPRFFFSSCYCANFSCFSYCSFKYITSISVIQFIYLCRYLFIFIYFI